MSSFNVSWNATNTASSTVPMGSFFGTATSNFGIYEVNTGSDASADNAVKYNLARASARGTASTSIVGQAEDQNVTQAALTTFDTAWNINPTISSAPVQIVLQWAQHQRGTYRWVAYDYTKFLRTQAGTGKGIVLQSVVVSSAFNAVFSVAWDE